ncbi:MAG TPA: nucleotide-binding protein, partial [Pyrinomonadaceae bacterium]
SVFIGSSSEGLEVARAIGEGLECCADPIIWDEDVFEFGRGYLEELVAELDKHDFAILVLTPDDVIESRGDSQRSPRDNVLFECGLFMGRLGRERTFIVCDRSTRMKLPSDLSGVSLISYDGKRMGDAPSSAVRGACMRINRVIKKPPFRELTGSWRSRYLLCHDEGEGRMPLVEEEVEIKPARGMLCIESKNNPKYDNYVAFGRPATGKHFVGEWQSTRDAASAGGAFFLTLHPQGNLMYGYYVSPADDHKVIHGGWVMARVGLGDIMARRERSREKAEAGGNGAAGPHALAKDEVLEAELNKLLCQGAELLKESAPILNRLDLAPAGAGGAAVKSRA